jgi:putative ABC transport system permease protein
MALVRTVPYSLAILWRDRVRFLPAVLGVAFSAVLIAVQCGLLFGLLSCASAPIDNASADLWITTREARGMYLAHPIPESWLLRVAAQPEVERVEPHAVGWGAWHKRDQGSMETCLVIGANLAPGALGVVRQISPEARRRLTEPDTVVVDEQDIGALGLRRGVGEFAEVNDHRVRVVGTVHGFQGVNILYIFCSAQTARRLLPSLQQPQRTMFGLARCRDPRDAERVARRLRERYPEMGVYTSADFSEIVRSYWLFRSNAGTVMICTVGLALLVGLVVTSQSMRAAVVASLREYAVLDALGIPRWRAAALVLGQSWWIGVAGLAVAFPLIFALSWAAVPIRTLVLLPTGLLLTTAGLSMIVVVLSGVAALRSLRRIEPANLLR